MENKDSYTPDEVARMINDYIGLRTGAKAVGNLEANPEVLASVLGTRAERDLFNLREQFLKIIKERMPDNVFRSLSPELQDLSSLFE